jgi:hypothetical protein
LGVTVSPARLWFGSTAAAVFAGLVVQVLVVATAAHSPWSSIPARIFNVFCYFTIQSNVIVGVTSLMLAVRLDRRSSAFAVCRLVGVVAITITGIVYHVAVAHLTEFDSWALVADQLTHTVVPIATVVGRLLFGPREELFYRTIQEAMANLRKHSRAKHVSVTLTRRRATLSGGVADDGRGFVLSETVTRADHPLHMGLETMIERVRLAGGELDIDSSPGEGTRISFEIPLVQELERGEPAPQPKLGRSQRRSPAKQPPSSA